MQKSTGNRREYAPTTGKPSRHSDKQDNFRKRSRTYQRKVHQLNDQADTSACEDSEPENVLSLEVHSFSNRKSNNDKLTITPTINKKPVPMEIDTGSSISLIQKDTYEKQFSDVKLCRTRTVLKTFSGEVFAPLGTLKVNVRIHGQRRKGLKLYVVDCGKNALLGRDWLRIFKLNWSKIHAVRIADSIHNQNEAVNAHVQKLAQNHMPMFEQT